MNEGAVVIKGRNNNKLILDKEGGVKLNTGNSIILVNTPNIPQPPVTTPSSETSTYITTNISSSLIKSIVNEPIKDIVPSYYPTKSISSVIVETSSILSDLFLPSTEETFNTLFGSSISVSSSFINTEEVVFRGNRSIQGSNNTRGTKKLSEVETEEILIKILEGLGITPTDGNIIFIKAWRQAEGGLAAFNAFNTTLSRPGATQYNNIGVKNFKNKEDGISANVQTLKEKQYSKMIPKLKNVKTIQDAYNLAVSESDGPGDGAFYIWSEGFYKNRINECKLFAAGTLDKTDPKRAAVIREFKGCPPPKNVSDKYIANVLKSWIRLGYTKPSQTKITSVIYGQ
jgi:hypothetical protein